MAESNVAELLNKIVALQIQMAELQNKQTGETGLTNVRDLERYVKAEKFTGPDDDFPDWSDTIMSHIGTLGGDIYDRMKEVSKRMTPLGDVEFDAAVKLMSRQVYHLLKCSTKKGAAKLVRSVTNHNGFEAWRLLHRRYGRQDLLGTLGTQQQLLSFDFGDSLKELDERFADFKGLLKELEESPSAETPNDTTLRALLLTKMPDPLRNHLQLNQKLYPTYLAMVEEVEERQQAENESQ